MPPLQQNSWFLPNGEGNLPPPPSTPTLYCYLENLEISRGQIKAFSFLFCTAGDAKSTKGVLLAVEKYKKMESVNTQNDYETTSKKWTDKKKFQENKFKIVQKNF